MTEDGFVRGKPWHIQGLEINADRLQTFGGGNGGGYIGDGRGWGPQEGPRRGEGRPSTIRDIPGPNVMSEFKGIQESGQAEIDDEYAVKFGTLPADVERELDRHKKAAKAGRDLTAAESAAVDQKVLLDLISSKLSQYISTAPGAYALYGTVRIF